MDISKIAILGSGSMGTAILTGLLKSGIDASSIVVTTKTTESAERLAEAYGVTAIPSEVSSEANRDAVQGADVILVAVKPAYVVSVLEQVSPVVQSGVLVVSVAAGITIAAMEAVLPATSSVVRSMPNTPAIIGRAVTGISAGTNVPDMALTKAVSLFETVGKVVLVDESQIDELSTISGSGPAYVFLLIEKFIEAATSMGFDPEIAKTLVIETFAGASELLLTTGKEPQELRRQVTSPNGTTERAIAVYQSANLETIFLEGTRAALARSKELAAGK